MLELLKTSIHIFRPALQRSWKFLILLTLTEESLNHWFMFLVQKQQEQMIYVQIVLFFIGLLWSFLFLTLLPPVIANTMGKKHYTSLRAHFAKYFEQISIESLRCLPPTLWRMLFFIIPGVLEMLRLMFVPFIVQFDGEYEQGNIDAITKARQICKGKMGFVIVTSIFSFVINILPYFLMGSQTQKEFSLPLFLIYVLLSAATNLFSQIIFVVAYFQIATPHARKLTEQRS